MGLDYTVHIGPYIKAKPITKKESVLSKKVHCMNKDCMFFDKVHTGKFCSECGTELRQIMVVRKTPPDPYELFGERLVELSPFMNSKSRGDYSYFIPNVEYGDMEHSFERRLEYVIVDLLNTNFSEDMYQFTSFFKKELDIIKENYEDITISWGIISTIN